MMPQERDLHTISPSCYGQLPYLLINAPAGTRFTPPGNIHSPFYPLRGPYSSRNKAVIRKHAEELLEAGVKVIVSGSTAKLEIVQSFQ